MRIVSCVLFLSLLVAGCVQSKSVEAEPAKWDYDRIHSYMANVPGIHTMERWSEAGVEGACIETRH